MEIYIVGGAVRDTLLGLTPKDRDYVVVGARAEDLLRLGYRQVGADFPVFHHPDTQDEYALARTERKNGHGYTGFAVSTESVTLEEDLSRRDLTINSMAMTQDGELVDPYGGANDLKAKILRHTTDSFAEDPLRILRVARFRARYGAHWRIAPETLTLMQQMVAEGEADYLTAERVWKELEKGLMEPHPELMLHTLAEVGIPARPSFQEYAQVQACYVEELKNAARSTAPLEVRFALAFSRTWSTEEAKCSRIPSAAREVSGSTYKLSKTLAERGEAQFSPEVILDALLSVDALRQRERFELIIGAVTFLQPRWADILTAALHRVVQVDPKSVIFPGMKGPEIQERIRSARLTALQDMCTI